MRVLLAFFSEFYAGWTFRFWGCRQVNKWKYFQDSEVEGLSDEIIKRLENAREIAGIPIVITSGLRTPETNQSTVGAVEDSSHLTGLAVDMRISESRQRFLMVSALLQVGFKRLGVYDKHIHADIDESKDQEVIWVGVSH